MRRPRWYPVGRVGGLLVLGHPAPQLPGARCRGDRRVGRGSAVPGLRGPGLFPPWPRDDDDGSDCSNRDGFLETLRVGDLLVKKMKTKRRTRRSRRFFFSQKDSKGPFSSGLSFFFKSSRVGGLNLSLTRNNEVHCSQFFYFDCFYIVCLFALWACFSVFFSKQELLLSPLELFMQQRNTFETAQIFNTTLFNMFRRLSWNGPNFFKASSLITNWQQMSSSFIQALLSKFRTEPIELL